jgi:hypothetical protein
MQNPLESEEAAFRFVLGTIVYFAAIVVAAWIETWLGVLVFVAMTVVAFVVLRRGTTSEPPVVSTERAAVEDTHRILVVTDSVVVGSRLREALLRLASRVDEDVLLICAVAPSPPAGDGGSGPNTAPSEQLEATLQELRAAGINARAAIAEADALSALEDALQRCEADEVLISLTSASDDIVDAVRAIFAGPVTRIRTGPPEARP